MKRLFIAGLLGLVASGSGVSEAVARTLRAELTHYRCRQAQNPSHRKLSATAVMRPLSGTQHMAIKFSLLRETAGSRSFHSVPGGDLNRWITPADPTLGQRPDDVWKLDKVVTDLAGPAAYRLRASFRWTDAQHHVLGRAQRTTPVCHAD